MYPTLIKGVRFECRYLSEFALKTDREFSVNSGTVKDTTFATGNLENNFSIDLFIDEHFSVKLSNGDQYFRVKTNDF